MTQYIFLSHSQNDIKKVRKIRDYLERQSFEPIVFNLKCLTDADELTSLVKREIEARRWFLYLNSKNAKDSARVQGEVSYAGSILNKHIFRVDLDQAWFVQKIELDRMIRKMKGYKDGIS